MSAISGRCDRSSLDNKGFTGIIWLSGNFFLQDTAGSHEHSAILPAQVANCSTAYNKASQIIKQATDLLLMLSIDTGDIT